MLSLIGRMCSPLRAATIHHTISISSWNVLAPCYKRLHGGAPGKALWSRWDVRESESNHLWKTRCLGVLDFVEEHLGSDVVCLQELYMHPWMVGEVQQRFGRKYDVFIKRQPGEKADGVATLIKKEFQGKELPGTNLKSIGGRGFQALVLTVPGSAGQPSLPVKLINVHLSFPHGAASRVNQLRQARAAAHIFEGDHRRSDFVDFVVGDLNSEVDSDVCHHLVREGFLHCSPGERSIVSHLNHLGQTLHVDHILARKRSEVRLELLNYDIHPGQWTSQDWPTGFELSDHRPISASLLFESKK